MADIKRFRLMDDQGNVIVYDIAAGSITFDDRNMTLPQVVAMLEEAIEGAGNVNTITLNGDTVVPDENGDVKLSIDVPEQAQADWDENDSSSPSYIKHKPTIPAGVVVDPELDAESDNAISNSAVAAAIAQIRTALETLVGEGVTDAIENFQEVLDFLENVTDEDKLVGLLTALQNGINSKVDTSDVYNALDRTTEGKVLDARQGKTLNEAIATLNAALGNKSDKSATVSGLAYDTTSHKLKQTVNGSTSDVLEADTVPTAGSDNFVTSGAVSTALATLLSNIHIDQTTGNWFVGNTDTGIKAQGPKGNSVADGDTFEIVNNLTDGGEEDALSAEMGKVLRINLMKIYNALGVYAFPDGKPALDWGSTVINHLINVNGVIGGLTISDVEIDGTSESSLPSQIADSKSLSLKLNLPSDMYVFDDGVTITMGGVNITNETGVWDESTGEIYIDEVMGDVVITAAAITYVQDNLVLHLDGKHRGGTGSAVAGHWTSLVNYNGSPIDFTLTSCDETHDDYVGFDGQNSKGIGSVSLLDVAAATGSIESVYGGVEFNSQACVIMHNALGSGSRICMSTGHGSLATGVNMLTMTGELNGNTAPSNTTYQGILQTDFLAGHYLSFVQGAFLVEGAQKTPASNTAQASNANSMLSLFYRKTSNDMFFKGSLYALRVYSDKLTPAEQLQNYKVDKKRFNL